MSPSEPPSDDERARERAPAADARGARTLRKAAVLLLIGLALAMVATLKLTPLTFVLFAFLGIPAVGVGVVLYVWHVIRELRARGAL